MVRLQYYNSDIFMHHLLHSGLALASPAEAEAEQVEISVKSSFKLDLPPHLIVPSSSIKLLHTVGQGYYSLWMECG